MPPLPSSTPHTPRPSQPLRVALFAVGCALSVIALRRSCTDRAPQPPRETASQDTLAADPQLLRPNPVVVVPSIPSQRAGAVIGASSTTSMSSMTSQSVDATDATRPDGGESVSVAAVIDAVASLPARMEALEARLRDAGAPPAMARSLGRSMLNAEAALRERQLEAGDSAWIAKMEEYRTARDAIVSDGGLDESARNAALTSVRQRLFGETPGPRFEATEALERMVRAAATPETNQ
ncbi:MAG: lipase secretion chaperone [Deltaproteobacteria bacterium]|nr:lipase secretion chaperone [Deltaproteobacteria bacterium]